MGFIYLEVVLDFEYVLEVLSLLLSVASFTSTLVGGLAVSSVVDHLSSAA